MSNNLPVAYKLSKLNIMDTTLSTGNLFRELKIILFVFLKLTIRWSQTPPLSLTVEFP